MRCSRPLALLVLAFGLAACQGRLPRWPGSPAPDDPQAEAMLRGGDYHGAMRRYEQLATASSTPDAYWLAAADAALRSGDGAAAQNLAAAIRPGELSGVDHDRYLLLSSRLDLNAGQAREALNTLNGLRSRKLALQDEKNYHILRASALNQLGNMVDSAAERIALDRLLSQPEDLARNNDIIFETLEQVPDPVLLSRQPTSDTLGGWMNLIHLFRHTSQDELPSAIAKWEARYPEHPARGDFLRRALADESIRNRVARPGEPSIAASGGFPSPPFVGVLLPLSGPYAKAASAIRDGLEAAHAADRGPDRASLYVSDSVDGDVARTARRLVDAGARAIIGPLIKDEVAALARAGNLPVPVLALNQVDAAQHSHLFQFGLTPEQEVEQVAASAWRDSKQAAIILHEDTEFGQRLSRHFEHYWSGLGGTVLDRRKFPKQGEPAPGLLSQLPASPVNAFVFLVAEADQARRLVPRLRTTPGWPIYATSLSYDGQTDEQSNQPLDGLIFCDMPWLLPSGPGSSLSAQVLSNQFPDASHESLKLMAMGVDAYRLLAELPRLGGSPAYRYQGATGGLALVAGNRIQRQLDCAQFIGSTPQARGPAPIIPVDRL